MPNFAANGLDKAMLCWYNEIMFKYVAAQTVGRQPADEKGAMMKGVVVFARSIVLTFILCTLVFLVCGCATDQMGETAAEGHRRHRRNLRINRQEMMSDVDTVLLLDEPSKLTDQRIP